MDAKSSVTERIRSIAGVVGGIGMIFLFVTFFFTYGDPGPGETKTTPHWVGVMGGVALAAILLAMLSGLLLWLHSKLNHD